MSSEVMAIRRTAIDAADRPTWGQILVATGRREEGLTVLKRAASGCRQLGQLREADEIDALIRRTETAERARGT